MFSLQNIRKHPYRILVVRPERTLLESRQGLKLEAARNSQYVIACRSHAKASRASLSESKSAHAGPENSIPGRLS